MREILVCSVYLSVWTVITVFKSSDHCFLAVISESVFTDFSHLHLNSYRLMLPLQWLKQKWEKSWYAVSIYSQKQWSLFSKTVITVFKSSDHCFYPIFKSSPKNLIHICAFAVWCFLFCGQDVNERNHGAQSLFIGLDSDHCFQKTVITVFMSSDHCFQTQWSLLLAA